MHFGECTFVLFPVPRTATAAESRVCDVAERMNIFAAHTLMPISGSRLWPTRARAERCVSVCAQIPRRSHKNTVNSMRRSVLARVAIVLRVLFTIGKC